MSVCKQTPRKNVQLVNRPSENTARDLYGDAMLEPIQMGTNMAARNQQKHLLLRFAAKAWTYLARNSKTLK